jgi:oligopeptide/dipeptide ABC transporter ATP-binding protein
VSGPELKADPHESETVDRSGELVLSVRDLVTEFDAGRRRPPVRAVRSISFDLRRGERLGLVGESGSGKSAAALSILGLLDPPGRVVSGAVTLNGRDLRTIGERAMQKVRGKEISLIYQDPLSALDPVKTIGKQITEAIHAHQSVSRAVARRRAAELLRDVDVPDAEKRLDDYPHQYSGGMRQRVVIAIALANNPDVIIADEPTTALDVTTQAQVLSLLDRLASERHSAILLITHNLGVVAGFCDRVMVMYAGRIVESASTDGLFERRAHPYTDALLRSVPRSDRITHGPLAAIAGAPPNLATLGPGCAFEPRCPLGKGRELCQTTAPPVRELPDSGRETRTTECHYATEQFEGATAA